jgi:hypothetical protein
LEWCVFSVQINLFLYYTKLNGYPSNDKIEGFIIVLDKLAEVFPTQGHFQGPQTPALEIYICNQPVVLATLSLELKQPHYRPGQAVRIREGSRRLRLPGFKTVGT